MSGPTTTKELLEIGERVLADSTHLFEDHDFLWEAKELLAHVLDVDQDDLDTSAELSTRDRDRYLALIARRAAGEPRPFLTGRIEFYGLDLLVRPGAFVPRPSSELIVDVALKKLKRKRAPMVVDVCAGSGPIALAIGDEIPRAEVWALDISEEGMEQGRANARRLRIPNVRFRAGDVYERLPARLARNVDLIAAHVPYVPHGEVDDLPSEVKEHEPIYTLSDASSDGLGLMRRVVNEATAWMKPGGWLLLEMSDDMAPKVRKICRAAGLEDHGAATDEDALSWVVEARMPG